MAHRILSSVITLNIRRAEVRNTFNTLITSNQLTKSGLNNEFRY